GGDPRDPYDLASDLAAAASPEELDRLASDGEDRDVLAVRLSLRDLRRGALQHVRVERAAEAAVGADRDHVDVLHRLVRREQRVLRTALARRDLDQRL